MPFLPSLDAISLDASAVIAAGLVTRLAVVVALAAWPAFPGVSARVRGALALALAIAAWPAAVAAEPAGAALPAWPLVIAGEAIVGLVIGMSLAAIVAAAGQAGAVLGSVSGLSWADDFAVDGGEAAAGIGRLAWWIGLAAFCAAGGQLIVVDGLVESVRTLPVGSLLVPDPATGWPPERLLTMAATSITTAFSLTITLAAPALAAVVGFHLASAICLRAVPFAPAAGLLQGLAALVMLAAFVVGLDAWATGSGTFMQAAVEAVFE